MLEYLKNHILEEIDDSINYMEKAIEHKGSNCGYMFYHMSEQEADHANWLSKIFNSMERPSDVPAERYADMTKEVLNKYSTSMGKLEQMKKLYWG